MLFLSFRLAYILKHTLPENQVGVFFCAAHYNSYRLVNFKHFPKYQDKESQATVKNLVKTIFGDDAVKNLHQNLLTNYFVDNVRVKSSDPTQHKPTLNERIFLDEILNSSQNHSSEIRNATVLFYVDTDNYAHIKKAAQDLGIDFDHHVEEFSAYIKCFLPYLQTKNDSAPIILSSQPKL